MALLFDLQASLCRIKSDLFVDFSKLAPTHSFPPADSKLLEPNNSRLINSLSFALHQPKEFAHFSEEPEVQNWVEE